MDFKNEQVIDADHHHRTGASSNDLNNETDLGGMEEAEFNEYIQANQLMSRNMITFAADPAAEPPPPWQAFNSAEAEIHHNDVIIPAGETTSKSEDHHQNHGDGIILLSRAELTPDDDLAFQAFLKEAFPDHPDDQDLDSFSSSSNNNNNNSIAVNANDSNFLDVTEGGELQQKFNEKTDVSEDDVMKFPAIVANEEATNSLQIENYLQLEQEEEEEDDDEGEAQYVQEQEQEESLLRHSRSEQDRKALSSSQLPHDEESLSELQLHIAQRSRIVSQASSDGRNYRTVLDCDIRPQSVRIPSIAEKKNLSEDTTIPNLPGLQTYLNWVQYRRLHPDEEEEEDDDVLEESSDGLPDVVMESETQALQTLTREALEEEEQDEEDEEEGDDDPIAKRLKTPEFSSPSASTSSTRSPVTRAQSPARGVAIMISDDELPEPSGFAGDGSAEPSMVCVMARNPTDYSRASLGWQPRRARRKKKRPWEFHESPQPGTVEMKAGDDADEEEEKAPGREEAYAIAVATTSLHSDQFKTSALQLHPRVLGFCYMLCNSNQSISEVWKLLTETRFNNPTDFTTAAPVPPWTPLMYADPVSRGVYVRYFPCVLGLRTMEITGIDPQRYDPADTSSQLDDDQQQQQQQHHHSTSGPEHWLSLPSLRYLPVRMDRIIAAAAGLLAVDGGIQPYDREEIRSGVNLAKEWVKFISRNAKYWKLKEYQDVEGQSVIVVTNPLTKEYKLLPPIPRKKLVEKVGAFIFTDASRTAYRLIVLGWVTLTISQQEEEAHQASGSRYPQRPQQEAALVIYSSQHGRWVHFDKLSNARPCPHKLGGPTGCVVMNYGVYFAGLRVTPKPMSRNDINTAAIFYLNCSKSRRQQLVFDFNGTQFYPMIKASEPPKIVAAGNNRVYAVSREPPSYRATTTQQQIFVFIIELVLNADGSPKGSYERLSNGVMPKPLTQKLFHGCDWHKLDRNCRAYDVHGGDHVIAFKVSVWDPDIALYHLATGTWSLTAFPVTEAPKALDVRNQSRDWLLIQGIYEPMWLAIP